MDGLPVSLSTSNPYAVVAAIFIIALLGWSSKGWVRDFLEHRRSGNKAKYDLAELIEEYTTKKMKAYEEQLEVERTARFKERKDYDKKINEIDTALRQIRVELLERDWDTQAAVGWGIAQQQWIMHNFPDASGMPAMPDRVKRIIERGNIGARD